MSGIGLRLHFRGGSMRRLFSGWRLMSQRCWRIGIRPTGSRCKEQRSRRSIVPGFVLVILPPTSCSLLLSRGFHRKLVDRLRKKSLLPAILLHRGQMDASADETEEIHIEPPAYMDDFSCRSSATRLRICGLLEPRRSSSRLPQSAGCS